MVDKYKLMLNLLCNISFAQVESDARANIIYKQKKEAKNKFGKVMWLHFLYSGFIVFFFQLSQPGANIDGQVSNPPSTSSADVNIQQTAPEQQQQQQQTLPEIKMEVKMEEEDSEHTDHQIDEKPEVTKG